MTHIRSLAHAQALIGKRVYVEAPEECTAPEWGAHEEYVTIFALSPTQPEVWRTSHGPLQWSRSKLKVTVIDT